MTPVQSDLFEPGQRHSSPPPSGPQTPIHTKAMNTYRAYLAWKRSEEGGRIFGWMLKEARKRAAAGAYRIGVKQLAEEARATLRGELNNVFTAWISDDLVEAEPGLLPLIERRVRKKAKA